jgi:hypothetical protein
MSDRSQQARQAIRSWIEAELSGLEERAERRLYEVFSMLPQPRPSVGFTASTLAALAPSGLLRERPERGGFRLLVAASLALAALALAVVPPTIFPVLQVFEATAVVGWVSSGVIAVAQRLGQAAVFWDLAGAVAAMVAETAQTPSSFAALALMLTLSFASLRALSGLVSAERR